jgi:Helix-hairpin-helix motif
MFVPVVCWRDWSAALESLVGDSSRGWPRIKDELKEGTMSRFTHANIFATALLVLGLFVLGGVVSGATQPKLPGVPGAIPKLDLNKAPLEQLQKLPGINEASAKKIIAGRPYKSVLELEKVGIPKPTIEQLTPMVTVGDEPTEAATPGAVAKVPPTQAMVWVNTESGIFYREGNRWYGKTREGKFMTEIDAQKAGYREAKR